MPRRFISGFSTQYCLKSDIPANASLVLNRSITLQLTADDYAVANQLHVLSHYRRPVTVVLVILWMAIVAGLIGVLGSWAEAVRTLPYILVLAVVGFAALMLMNYYVVAPMSARRIFPKQKTLHAPLTFSWSEAGLKTENLSGTWEIAWSDYLRFRENASVMLFYQAPRLFQMLPKRVLTAEQINDLREYARRIAKSS